MIIVYKGLVRVFFFIVDIVDDRLYWVDFVKYIFEGSDFDGLNRRVVRCLI